MLTTSLYPVTIQAETTRWRWSLPVKIRDDLSFDECIVIQLIIIKYVISLLEYLQIERAALEHGLSELKIHSARRWQC